LHELFHQLAVDFGFVPIGVDEAGVTGNFGLRAANCVIEH